MYALIQNLAQVLNSNEIWIDMLATICVLVISQNIRFHDPSSCFHVARELFKINREVILRVLFIDESSEYRYLQYASLVK